LRVRLTKVEDDPRTDRDIQMVVDCILVECRLDAAFRDRVVGALIGWAEEHPEEWGRFLERCRQRQSVPV
jgi:hypothetical protein